MFHRKWPGAAAGAALALAGPLVLSACGGSSGSSSTLTLGVITPATTFEAPDMNWGNESTYNQAVYDSLVQASPAGVIEPHLATAWSYNAARTVLTMTLRTGVTFTDGTPFNASVAVKNLEAFQKGTSNNASDLVNMASATVVSPTELVIRLKQPDPAFLTYLGEAAGSQESPNAWKTPTAATVPVGSGPYVLDTKATVVGSSYVFTANPNYWDKPEQHYSKIVMNVYTTATTVLDAIEGGQVNAANTFDDTTIPQIQDAGFTVYPLQLNWAGLSLFDRDGTMSGPLGKVQVRQAINMAFDRAALLKDMSDGYGSVTTQVFPPNSPGYESSLNSYYSFDPAKAKQLLADAGYPGGGFSLKYIYESGYWWKRPLGELFQSNMKDLGITVDIQEMSPSAWAATLSNPDTAGEAFGLVWWPTLATPYDYMWSIFDTGAQGSNGYNWGYYSNPKLDKLLDAASAEPDDAKRSQMYGEAQKLLVEESPALYVYEKNYRLPMSDKLQGFVFNGIYIETIDFYAVHKG